MSVPYQKIVMIDRLTPPDTKYFKIKQEVFFLAAQKLTKYGIICYSYFASRPPHTWEGKTNEDNKHPAPYEISTSDIAKECFISTDGARDGIKNLIDNKYLILIKGNFYQFRDILPEDMVMSSKQYEEKLTYEEMIKAGQDAMKKDIQKELKKRAISSIEKEAKSELLKESPALENDWMEESDLEMLKRYDEKYGG